MIIREVKPEDARAICDIYNYHIENTIITFEEKPLSEAEMKERIRLVTATYPWLVAEEDGILGYAYASKFRERSAWRYAVSVSVYCGENHKGKGIGSLLYTELLKRLKEQELKVAYGGIALPNEASVRLHEKLGFRKVAHFSEGGFKLGRWIDVGYWEYKLN